MAGFHPSPMFKRRPRLRSGLTDWLRETSAIASRSARGFANCESTGGAGYRVYYTMIAKAVVLLLCGGDKQKQSSDIERARNYLKDYRTRSRTE